MRLDWSRRSAESLGPGQYASGLPVSAVWPLGQLQKEEESIAYSRRTHGQLRAGETRTVAGCVGGSVRSGLHPLAGE